MSVMAAINRACQIKSSVSIGGSRMVQGHMGVLVSKCDKGLSVGQTMSAISASDQAWSN